MSIDVNIRTADLGRAKVVTNRNRASVHLREWVGDPAGRYLSADVTLWCRDAEEAEGIAEAINKATERQKALQASGPVSAREQERAA